VTLRERLEGLRSLERDAFGATPEGLSLKQRLERLVAASAGASRQPTPVPALEQASPGRVVSNERGQFYLLERALHVDTFHGDVALARLRALPAEALEILAGEAEAMSLDLSRAVFLDTETTGLAGGAGTAAFLIGTGFLEGDHFTVRQYFMRDYNEEPAMLLALASDLARFEHVVTFNGKMFDVPLLEARFRLNRSRFPLSLASHLDMLHPARRLWKLRLESCRLQSLESALLGVTRHADIPGEQIPHAYFRFVRTRDPRAVGRIFDHNRTDIVSLAALLALACQWVHEARAEDARDVLSLGRVFERAKRYERSQAEYRRALEIGEGPLRVAALLRLGSHAKRSGDGAAAEGLWEEAARQGACAAFRELAVYHERRRRDASAALRVVEAALQKLADRDERCCRRALAEFGRRRVRLQARLRRSAAVLPSQLSSS
jgi:uncharacterized protein YprB with RNaseH-like and TPR domain